MTDQPVLTLARSRTYHVVAFASHGNGTMSGDVLDLTVEVYLGPAPITDPLPGDEPFDRIGAWLAQYVDQQDLTHVFDFAPTVERLAVHLARVAGQFAGPHFSHLHVRHADGSGCTAIYQ